MKEKVIIFLNKYWFIRMLLLVFFRPKRFLFEFYYSFVDYKKFKKSIQETKLFYSQTNQDEFNKNRPGLLIVAGQMMSAQWLQIWTVLGSIKKSKGYNVYAITSKSQPIQNLYLKLFHFNLIYIENLRIDDQIIPQNILNKFNELESFHDFKSFEIDNIPLGKMALSTYSRHKATGILDVTDSIAKDSVRNWLKKLYKTLIVSKNIFLANNIEMLYFTEVFMEEYGALYYSALKEKLNIIRFAGTVRDDAIVVQHMNSQSDRTHFSSLSKKSWEIILNNPYSTQIDYELNQNFQDRYGSKWGLSKRNQLNTTISSLEEAKTQLNIKTDKKIAIIYSHILYDTLFFNGEDLFDNYADWLIQTVKAACNNDKVQWFIKVHPSNLWRGELESFLNGKYEEVRLIEEFVGQLPEHVKFIYPDTNLSPYTWLQLTDFGITVRGTSGIELGALGKIVITAGSGRYEDIGFSYNSVSKEDYLLKLKQIPEIESPTLYQIELGKKFAYATFCMKPFTLDFLKPTIRTGKTDIFNSDDLVFIFNNKFGNIIPNSISNFYEWSVKPNEIDFLKEWPY